LVIFFLILALILGIVVLAVSYRAIGVIRQRGAHRWAVPYIVQSPKRRRPGPQEEVHLILCFADHFEPRNRHTTAEQANARVERWLRDYPRQFSDFRDSDGRPPRYTFFYPIEDYCEGHVGALTELCRAGFGEVEIHLHHDNDTAANLRATLLQGKQVLAERHGQLARDPRTGEVRYGFIHGNWTLCNPRPDGRFCGVNEELDILRETGCYADFTMPSAPHPTQIGKINSLYYAVNRPGQPRSHEIGIDVGQGAQPPGSLLLVQGPLLYDWRNRKYGIVPHLENGCVQGSQSPHVTRVDSWLRARIQVPARPDWFFVKLHAHGAEECSHQALLGDPMVQFHRDLANLARSPSKFHYHYVTAREMYNLIKAAEGGWKGTVREAVDYELVWNGAVKQNQSSSLRLSGNAC
jgi:hypothetical protein